MIDESRFHNTMTLRLFYGERVRRYPPDLDQRTRNKLKIVYAANRHDDEAQEQPRAPRAYPTG